MRDASIIIPNYIVSPHPDPVKTSETFCKCTLNFVAPMIWWKKPFAALFSHGILSCLIFSVLEGPHKSTKNGLAMGVTIGGDAKKSDKNTHLLVIMRMRLLQKTCLLDLANRNWFKNETAGNNVKKVCAITAE